MGNLAILERLATSCTVDHTMAGRTNLVNSKEQLDHLLKLLKSDLSQNSPVGSVAQTSNNSLAL